MEFKGVQYAWAPMDGFICVSHSPPLRAPPSRSSTSAHFAPVRLTPARRRHAVDSPPPPAAAGPELAAAPFAHGDAQMYKVHSSAPRVLARVSRVPNSVTLELTQEAFQGGLLEPALVVTVLLSCGHNID